MKFPNLPVMPAALTGAEVIPGTQTSVDGRTTTQAIANLFKGTSGTAIASATTIDLGAATGVYVHVTGTTGITGMGTVAAGTMRWVVFDGVLTLTHNATSLILPTAANITTAAGDAGLFVSEGSGNWRCTGYWRQSGQPLVTASTINTQSVASAATVTPTFSNDIVDITAQAVALALANPTGTAQDAWAIVVRIKDNGTARAISYGTQYRALGVTLPTTTVATKTTYLGMIFNNAATKWDVVSVAQEA